MAVEEMMKEREEMVEMKVEEEEEEVVGGLEARKRVAREAKPGMEYGLDGVAEERKVEEGGDRSVYLDQDQGTISADGIAVDFENIDDLIAETRIGKVDLSNTKSNGEGDFIVEDEKQSTKDTAHNMSNSHMYSEKIIENGATKGNPESEVEIDLERVLEEQETHDLFCPNCHSCITKRVILRKRKRTVPEVKSEAEPERDEVQVGPEGSSSLPEATDQGHDQDQEFIRCLSCFSIFFPADCGFNIFRLFGKREESTILQTPEEIPVRGGSCVLPLDETSAPLLGDSSNNFLGGTENRDVNHTNNTQSPGLPGAMGLGEHQNTNDVVINAWGGSMIYEEFQGDIEEKHNDLQRNNDAGDEIIQAVTDGVQKPVKQIAAQTEISQLDHNIDIPPAHELLVQLQGQIIVEMPSNNVGRTSDLGVVERKPVKQIEAQTKIPRQDQNIAIPPAHAAELPLQVEGQIIVELPSSNVGRTNDLDVLKSIVYGGLIESITSLSVVSSAAGAGSKTMNIIALGLANIIGGLFIITNDLWELKGARYEASDQLDEQAGRYWELLGRKVNFRRHATVALLSYIIFGLLPPVVYGFSFRESDNVEYKLIIVAATSLLCIALLALGRAHVTLQKTYMKTLSYYLGLGFTASGLSFVAGVMIDRLLKELGWFDQTGGAPPAPPSFNILKTGSNVPVWSSY